MADYNLVQEALNRGYSFDEIADKLSSSEGIDPVEARNRGYSSHDILGTLGYKAQEESAWDALKRGGTEAFQQLPQLARGVQAGIGAAGESAFGEGGLFTGIKKSGIEGYKEWGDKIAKNSQEADSIDYSWDKAKEGDFGSLVNWLSHGLGYVGGQAIQTIATGGIGAVGGKFVAGTAAKQIAEGMVAKEATRLAAENAGLAVGKRMAADAITQAATRNVASKFATIGATTALGLNATGMEGGEIFGGLTSKNPDRVLTGSELGKAFASTLAAGGLEFVGDKLGLDIMLGKSSLLKPAQYAKGMGGRAARGLIAGGLAAPIEAGTEYLQTGLEEFGKGAEANILPFNQSESAQKQAREGAALGALGGAVMGGFGGALRGAKKPQDTTKPDPRILARETTLDQAIVLANEPLTTPTNFSATPSGLIGTTTNVTAGPGFDARSVAGDYIDGKDLADLVQTERRDLQVMRANIQRERIKQAELDQIPQIAAEQNQTQEVVDRAGTLEAPTAMRSAFDKLIDRTIAPKPAPPKPAPEPRIVERTEGMKPMPKELAELQVDMDGGEVVRIKNRNGKYAYTVIKDSNGRSNAPVIGIPITPVDTAQTATKNIAPSFSQALDSEHEHGVSTGDNSVVRSKQDLEEDYGPLSDKQVEELRNVYQDGVAVSDSIETTNPIPPATQREAEGKFQAEPDNWLQTLFGGEATSQPATPTPASKTLDVPTLRTTISTLATDLQTQRDDWVNRKYKANGKQVMLNGDGPSSQGSLSVSSINEGRRTKAVQAFDDQLGQLAKLETQLKTPDGAKAFTDLVQSKWNQAQAFKPQSPDQLSGGALFESLMIDALKLQPAQGSYTSLPITKALRATMESNSQPQEKPNAQASEAIEKPSQQQTPAAAAVDRKTLITTPVSQRSSEGYLAKVEQARKDAEERAKAAPRETITPANDKNIGVNADGEPIYERKDGSVYKLDKRNGGKPNFGSDLAVVDQAPTETVSTLGKQVSSYIGQFKKGMGKDAAKHKASELNKANTDKSITYTFEEHGDPNLEHQWAVVGRKVEAQPELVQSKYDGKTIYVKKSDLDSDKPRMSMYDSKGQPLGKVILRENLDPTGEQQAARNADNADNPLFNVITTKNGQPFASKSAASLELRRNGLKDSHEVVPASEVSSNATGFVLRKVETVAPVTPAKDDVARKETQVPWQMTRAEYTEQQPPAYRETVGNAHKVEVARAIANGKDVPAKVLADYPELVKTTEQAETGNDVMAEIAPATKSPADLVAGDRFKDANGAEFQVWSARQGRIEAHPVVDGKPVVNRDSVQRWATTDAVRGANPEYRTDIVAQPAAIHKDPGKAPETATAPVIAQSLAKAARKEDNTQKEMRLWLLDKIDAAMKLTEDYAEYQKSVKDNGQDIADSIFFGKYSRNIGLSYPPGNGMITFDVPGDGKFKVRNSLRGLMEFRAKVDAKSGTGFTDKTTKPKGLPATTGVAKGSSNQIEALSSMLEELDFEAAVDYARETGISLDDAKIAPYIRNQFKAYLKDGTLPAPPFSPSRYWEYQASRKADKDGNPIRTASLTKEIGADEYAVSVSGTNATGFKFTVTKNGNAIENQSGSYGTFSDALQDAESKINSIQPEVVKPKDTGWNMAGVGYAGKRYRGRNITLDDGREVVARIYDNAGQYEDAEVKVDGKRVFAKTDRYKAEKLADDFIRTLTAVNKTQDDFDKAKAEEQNQDDHLPKGWKKDGAYYEFRSASGSKFTPTQISEVVGGTVTKQGMYSIIGVPVNGWETAKRKLKDAGMWIERSEVAQKEDDSNLKLMTLDALNRMGVAPTVADGYVRLYRAEPSNPKDRVKNGDMAGRFWSKDYSVTQAYGDRVYYKDVPKESVKGDGSEVFLSKGDAGEMGAKLLEPGFYDVGFNVFGAMEEGDYTSAIDLFKAESGIVDSKNDEPIPAVTETQARKQFEWRNMGQKDGTKSHRLFWSEKESDKGTGQAMNKGDVSLYPGASGWKIEDGDGTPYPSLADAKSAAIDAALVNLQENGYVLKTAAKADAEQRAISSQLKATKERELQFNRDSQYSQLMQAKDDAIFPIVDSMTYEDAQAALDRLNAAPGTNAKVQAALAVKLDSADAAAAKPADPISAAVTALQGAVNDLAKAIQGPQETTQPRAKEGGEYGPNGEWYKGGAFIATTDMPKKTREWLNKNTTTGQVQVDQGNAYEPARVGEIPIVGIVGGTVLDAGRKTINEAYLEYQKQQGVSQERIDKLREVANKFIAGERWVKVNDYPEFASVKDLARMIVNGQPIPGAALEKFPANIRENFKKVGAEIAQPAKAIAPKEEAKEGSSNPPPESHNTGNAGSELTYNKRNRIKTGIKWDDIEGKDDALKVKETNKQNVYPKPDYQSLIDGGMHPVVAHIVKQVYDSIATTPKISRGVATDDQLKQYIDGVHRVMDAVMSWATNGDQTGQWMNKVAERASAYLGASRGVPTALSAMTQSNQKTLLDTVYPNGWMESRAEISLVGSNKLLAALQPSTNEAVKAKKEIAKGWPEKQEAWKKQGYNIIDGSTAVPNTYVSSIGVWASLVAPFGGRSITIVSRNFDTATSADDAAVQAFLKLEGDAYKERFVVLDKNNRLQAWGLSQEAAEEQARNLTKRESKSGKIDEKGISVESAERVGIEHRLEGEDISSDKLEETFGFKGVNFGTWMLGNSPKLVAERQLHLNHAYDSFMDLAEVLGVPPKALSLDGLLGIAIGAQGGGTAAAHFVPGVNEINLTRTSGAGSLAHEWGHALDHYFARQADLTRQPKPFLTSNASSRFIAGTIRPEIVAAFKSIVASMTERKMTQEEFDAERQAKIETNRKYTNNWLESIKRDFALAIKNTKTEATPGVMDKFDALAERVKALDIGEGRVAAGKGVAMSPVVSEMRDLFKTIGYGTLNIEQIKGLQGNIDALKFRVDAMAAGYTHVPNRNVYSKYLESAKSLDKGKTTNLYWSTKLEMFARAFDAFVSDALEAKAAKNTYLSHAGRGGETVPNGSERTAINADIQKLIDTIETKETDKGVAMFSRDAMGTYAKHSIDPEKVPVGDWKGRVIFHGTSDAGAKSIHSNGVIIDKSTGGYFGVGFYAATDATLAANSYADFAEENDLSGEGSVIAVKIKNNARILDMRSEKDWETYQKTNPDQHLSSRNFAERMRSFGIDGLFDRSFGGLVIYNPKAIEVLPDVNPQSRGGTTNPTTVPALEQAIRELTGKFLGNQLGKIVATTSSEIKSHWEAHIGKVVLNSKTQLLAPNGRVSNLTPRQHAHVRTPEFKAWFGDWEAAHKTNGGSGVWSADNVSKVVDENGEPLVVYHGTDKGGFLIFNEPGGHKRGDLGIWATSNKELAQSYIRKGRSSDMTLEIQSKSDLEENGYEFSDLTDDDVAPGFYYSDANGNESGPFKTEQQAIDDALTYESDPRSVVYAAFMNIKNPNESYFGGANWTGEREGQYSVWDSKNEEYVNESESVPLSKDDAEALYEKLGDEEFEGRPRYDVQNTPDHYETTDSVVAEGRRYHNDGAIIHSVIDDGGGHSAYSNEPSNLFVAFKSNQVKSADFNEGTYSKTDDRINKSESQGVAQAFFDPTTKTIFLIADHIEAGTEQAVAAHELMHKHGKAVLGEAGWNRLHSVIDDWYKAAPGTDERRVYDYAADRVQAIGGGEKLSSQELFPYAVEAALKFGIKPSMQAKQGTVARWLESVRQNLKAVWAKITNKPETFKAQDLVNLAFAIAQRENNPKLRINEQTESPNFKKWFGDSKVVDADGNPLVVYQGTTSRVGIDSFDRKFSVANGRPSTLDTIGSWFSTQSGKDGAEKYSGENGSIYPVYLSIKNPVVMTFDELRKKALRYEGKGATRVTEVGAEALREDLMYEGYDGVHIYATRVSMFTEEAKSQDEFAKWALGKGYTDAAAHHKSRATRLRELAKIASGDSGSEFDKQDVFIAFGPTQIKSATGNNGNYDGTNPDIRYSTIKAQTMFSKVDSTDKTPGALFDIDEYVEYIEPPHHVKDKQKLGKLLTEMENNGWVGRPILAYQNDGEYFALTGSHRIAAAKKLGIEIPVMLVDDDVVNFENDSGEFLQEIAGSGDDRVAVFLRDAGDSRAADLMDAEVEAFFDNQDGRSDTTPGGQTQNNRNALAAEYYEYRKSDPARAKAAFQAMSAIDAEVRRKSDAQDAAKPKAEDTYRGEHEAPMHDSGAPLHDLKGVYPDDFYGPQGKQYYGIGDGSDVLAMSIVRATKGRAGMPITIYRAVPKEVTTKIEKGNWVTIDRQYAKDHGDGALNGQYKIIKKTVRADELFTNGDSIQEWGYDPKKQRNESTAPDSGVMFSRTQIDTPKTVSEITAAIKEATTPIGTVSLWDKTVGTQYNKSTKDADFKRVFDGYNQQVDDTAHYAIEAEKQAPSILMRLETLGDLWDGLKNSGAKQKADIKAVSTALFANIEGNKGIQQFLFDDLTLKQVYKLTPHQIEMYHQARKAVDTSIERLAQTYAAQLGQDNGMNIADVKNYSLEDTVEMVKTHIQDVHDDARAAYNNARQLMSEITPEDEMADETAAEMKKSFSKIPEGPTQEETDALLKRLDDMQAHAEFLQGTAYMPALRFGEYAVTVTDKYGNVEHFEMFESKTMANVAKMKLKKEYPNSTAETSVMNKDQYAMFKGVSPETVEMFAKFTGMDQNEAVQGYIALAKSARSVKMRELQRKGTAGFSEDATRVLASFITSNARQSAINMNQGAITDALTSKSLAKKGDVQREAQKLSEYMNNPMEEARRLRGFMFMHFLGGSVASAIVNLTQPIMQTAPYLHQFAGAKTAKIMASSAKMAATGKIDGKELQAAVKRASEDGITEPNEIHQLMADAGESSMGGSLRARAIIKAWGSMFSLAESFNRRITFIAAYQTAIETKQADPYEFARKAVIETQGLYSKVNRPNWARGAVGATIFTFKQFSIAYIEFLARLPAKQKVLALTILVLAAGLQGLPGADDLEDLIDTIGQSMGYNTNSKKALRKMLLNTFGKDVGTILDVGLLSALSAVDVHGRLGMGNLIPGTSIFKPSETDKSRSMAEFAGPIGSLLTSFQKAMAKVQLGDTTGAVTEVTPVAVRNLLKGLDMAKSGVYKDAKGYKVADVDLVDSYIKMVGFQPSDIAARTRIISDEIQGKSMTTLMESIIAERWAQGVHEKDFKKVMDARRTLNAWNINNPESRIVINQNQISSRVKKMNQTRAERYLKTVPKEQRRQVAEELR